MNRNRINFKKLGWFFMSQNNGCALNYFDFSQQGFCQLLVISYFQRRQPLQKSRFHSVRESRFFKLINNCKASLRNISGTSQNYIKHISDISQVHIGHIPAISYAYLSHIQAYLRYISSIFHAYLWPISGLSKSTQLRYISEISQTYFKQKSAIS